MLAALAVVDAVVIFDEATPLEIVTALQPDVLVKGADWAAGRHRRGRRRRGRGGRVVRIPLAEGYSTTKLMREDRRR